MTTQQGARCSKATKNAGLPSHHTARPSGRRHLLLRCSDNRSVLPAVLHSRLARRENVEFHATAAEAERAGFRPCKRCRPNGLALPERQAAAVARACRLIEDAEEIPSLDALAEVARTSRFHFHRVFKAQTGVTPNAYADAHRAERVQGELARRATVTEAI